MTQLSLNLKVKFIAGDKGITSVTVVPHQGMTWEFESSKKQPQLEKLIGEWMECYSKGKQPKVVLPIDLHGFPPYTWRVLSRLREVPFGESLTYQQLAESTGSPKGARAAGNACGRNPCLIIIPCHRILASNGLGGFSSGLDLKKSLLTFEKIKF